MLAIVEYENFAGNLEFAENCYFSYCGIITGEDSSEFRKIELDHTYKCEIDVLKNLAKQNGVVLGTPFNGIAKHYRYNLFTREKIFVRLK